MNLVRSVNAADFLIYIRASSDGPMNNARAMFAHEHTGAILGLLLARPSENIALLMRYTPDCEFVILSRQCFNEQCRWGCFWRHRECGNDKSLGTLLCVGINYYHTSAAGLWNFVKI